MPAVAAVEFLSGFERLDASVDGGSWADQTSPWRGVLHTTEGSTLDSAVGTYRTDDFWPHFTVDPVSRRRVQHISLNRSDRALEHKTGAIPETNRMRAISVEIVGNARHAHLFSEDSKLWLAREVLGPIASAVPIRRWTVPFFGEDAGFTLAAVDAPQRMTIKDWEHFDGWCGHQHVPANVHWDPGALDVAGILRLIDMTVEEAQTMSFVHAEVWNSQETALANGRWTFFVVSTDGHVDVMNDFTAHPGPSTIWHGDLRGKTLNKPIIAFAQTPTGNGYYLVGGDGGVFAFGDAKLFQDGAGRFSLGGVALAGPIEGIQLLQTGDQLTGYILLATDGGTFQFGAGDPHIALTRSRRSI